MDSSLVLEFAAMNANMIAASLLVALVLFASATQGMNLDFEVTSETATAFLHTFDTNGSIVMDRRETGSNCVPCKLGVNPCCAPNVCVKKTLRPDECMELRASKKHV